VKLTKTLLFAVVLLAIAVSAWAESMPVKIAGVITAVNVDQHSFMLRVPNHPELVTVLVTEDTKIYKDRHPATLDQLLVGDEAMVYGVPTPAGFVARLVAARTPKPPVIRLEGRITAVDLDHSTVELRVSADKVVVIVVTDRTAIFKNGHEASIGDLAVGDIAKAAVTKTPEGALVAVAIHAFTPPPPIHCVEGVVTAVDAAAGTLTVKAPVGEVTVKVTDRTKIMKDGHPATLEQIAVNDLAKVCFYVNEAGENVAVAICAKSPVPQIFTARGIIVEIDPEHHVFKLKTVGMMGAGDILTFRVTADTHIFKMGREVEFGALMVGDAAEVAFVRPPDGPPIALKVVVLPSRASGSISEIDLEHRVIVLLKEGVATKFFVAEDAKIMKNGAPAHLADLAVRDLAVVDYFQTPDGNVAVAIMAKSPLTR